MSGGAERVRIAMWSGPRNISTALMRSFENRPDCAVWDEPFYAHYLSATGLAHPMRAEIIAAGERDWRAVAAACAGPAPGGAAIFYQKHMTHHMTAAVGWEWAAGARHAMLIRRPERVLASYARKREAPTLADIGFVEQQAIFERLAEAEGAAPPVVDADDLLAAPEATLRALCAALGVSFAAEMLSWPAGPRESDGVWAAHWYDAVRRSTGFAPPPEGPEPTLAPELAAVAEAARPAYEALARWRLRAA